MEHRTKQEIIDSIRKNESREFKQRRRDMEALQRDIRTATDAIEDAKARYIKRKLRLRSKKEATAHSLYAELADYNSEAEIQDAYGYGYISEAEMRRLQALWEARAETKTSDKYVDRVTEMLERAERAISAVYAEDLAEWENDLQQIDKAAERIFREQFTAENTNSSRNIEV